MSKSMKRFMSLTPRIDPVAARPLASDEDIYLYVRIGAATMQITALAPPSVNPVRLARALESAAYTASPGKYDVGWSSGSYSAASTEASLGHLGALEASNTYSIGKVIATMRSFGFAPRVFLGRLRYTESPALGVPRYLSPSYAWYSLANISPDYRVTYVARCRSRA